MSWRASPEGEPAGPPLPVGRRGRGRLILQGLVSAVIVGGIFVGVMPSIASYSEVWGTIADMTWLELAVLVVAGSVNLATYWWVMTAVLPGLTIPQAGIVNQASTAVANTLPGGGALGVGVSVAMYRSWGFSGGSIVLATLVSGVWNTFVKLGLPVVALVLLAATGHVGASLWVAAATGVGILLGAIVVFSLMLRDPATARRVGSGVEGVVNRVMRRLRRRPREGWGAAWEQFSASTTNLVRDRWPRISVAAVVNHLSLYVVLLLALRYVGVSADDLRWIDVLAGFAFVRLLSALPVTPGGVGVVELGYAALLGIGMDASGKAEVVAAVLVFRFITYVLPVPLGAASYIYWRRERRWRGRGVEDPET